MNIKHTKADGSEGIITIDGIDYSGPLPPNAGDLKRLYDQWLSQGNTPEPYVPPVLPPVSLSWTPLQFMEKFTYEERVALRTLAKNDPMAEDWLDLLRASQEVRMDDQRTMAGLNYMVLKGVLTYSRVAEITAA